MELELDIDALEDSAPKFAAFYNAMLDGEYNRLLWVSSVRGGKTCTVVLGLITMAIRDKLLNIGNGQYLLGGKSTETIVRAQKFYWQAICKELGLTFIHVRGNQNYFAIPELDCIWSLFGGAKKGDDDALLGQTITSAYVDEACTLDAGFLLEAERRCSFKESVVVMTSNGGLPLCGFNEYFWTDGKAQEHQAKTFRTHTSIDDNPFIDEDRKQRYRNENRDSVGYAQRILGLFVAPEGLVVNIGIDSITSERPAYTDKPTGWVSIDVGETGVTHGLLWTHGVDSKYLVSDAYVWNAQKQGMRHWNEMMQDMLARWNVLALYYDPAAPMFAHTARKHGVRSIGADNDMGRGWPAVNNALIAGTFKVHESCIQLLRECASLEWNEITGKPKSDQPRHGVDALRYGVMRLMPPVRTQGVTQ